jgi:hypothetical protein
MRDIRGDLQDRANRVSEQISATHSQLAKVIEQLKLEHQAKLQELKSDVGALRMVMKTEDRLLSAIVPVKQSELRVPQGSQQAPSQQETSNSLMRKVSALS